MAGSRVLFTALFLCTSLVSGLSVPKAPLLPAPWISWNHYDFFTAPRNSYIAKAYLSKDYSKKDTIYYVEEEHDIGGSNVNYYADKLWLRTTTDGEGKLSCQCLPYCHGIYNPHTLQDTTYHGSDMVSGVKVNVFKGEFTGLPFLFFVGAEDSSRPNVPIGFNVSYPSYPQYISYYGWESAATVDPAVFQPPKECDGVRANCSCHGWA
eukprot:TRINITY_DN32982_c0_g1_i1.p1 TRINITY_DN32982_c0_g1~~TRINITY_DN32982_c0_g1_i1.p1  ORF type:complete len:208 (+),score=18.73 TRINITY_DN32982_c0_g1_i1:25-648(+)